ncbi:hypothetical protein M6B38_200360 [Iris pallida]|uniref:Uncharacterized protein n=1 Tax=Iris pallida TaxID=29817 RepID=A0AAX6EA87_IRIPA|nr:hypothetical protein M6B38_200360 [Iris pallida]
MTGILSRTDRSFGPRCSCQMTVYRRPIDIDRIGLIFLARDLASTNSAPKLKSRHGFMNSLVRIGFIKDRSDTIACVSSESSPLLFQVRWRLFVTRTTSGRLSK